MVPLFYANEVLTEKGQSSIIPIKNFDIRNDFICAAFLCDVNTPFDPNLPLATGDNKLYDGNPLVGLWIKCMFKTADIYDGTYFELIGINIAGNFIEKSGTS